jgi:hypothetical protein
MGMSVARISQEIAAVDAVILGAPSTSVSADGVSRTIDLTALYARRDQLQRMLDRATGSSPMILRGVVKGLR